MRSLDSDHAAGAAFVTKTTPTPAYPAASKGQGPQVGKRPTGLRCFVCGDVGHITRNCDKRAHTPPESALIIEDEDRDDEDPSWYPVYLAASHEQALFTDLDVLLDNEASISVFRNKNLLGNIQRATKPIRIKGVQTSAEGIVVKQEGHYRDLGLVYQGYMRPHQKHGCRYRRQPLGRHRRWH